jgi:methionine-gamma-lyase
MTDTSRPGFATRAIHYGYDAYAGHGSLNPPVYPSSTYTFPTGQALERI